MPYYIIGHFLCHETACGIVCPFTADRMIQKGFRICLYIMGYEMSAHSLWRNPGGGKDQ